MLSLNTFKTRMSATSGSSIRDESIKNSKQLLNLTFFDDASFNPNIVLWNTTNQIKCRIFDKKKSSTTTIATVQVLIDSSLMVGDILYDTKDNLYWMVTELHNIGDIHKQGKIELCNYTIKFQSPDGTILSYPCITSGKTYDNDENKIISLASNQKSVLLPYDDNTKLLDTDKRLFVDRDNKKPFKVIGAPDNTTYDGLIYFVTQADTLQETDGALPKDRSDLGICNYFSPTVPPEPTPDPSGYTLNISSSGDFNLGTTRILTPTLKDSLGNVVSTWAAIWSVNYNGMDHNWFVIDDTMGNNKCSVEVLDDVYEAIDGVLELTCTVGGETISATYNGTITA